MRYITMGAVKSKVFAIIAKLRYPQPEPPAVPLLPSDARTDMRALLARIQTGIDRLDAEQQEPHATVGEYHSIFRDAQAIGQLADNCRRHTIERH